MKVKEIIAFACSFIGEQEIVKKLTSTEAVSLTDKEQEKVDTLVIWVEILAYHYLHK